MTTEDLNKLRLDKTVNGFRRRLRVPRRALLAIAAAVAVAAVTLFAANPGLQR